MRRTLASAPGPLDRRHPRRPAIRLRGGGARAAQRPVPDLRRPAAGAGLLRQPARPHAEHRRPGRRRGQVRPRLRPVPALQPVAHLDADRPLPDDHRRHGQHLVLRRRPPRVRLAAEALQGQRLRHAPRGQGLPRGDRRHRRLDRGGRAEDRRTSPPAAAGRRRPRRQGQGRAPAQGRPLEEQRKSDRIVVLEGEGESHVDYKTADRAIDYLRRHAARTSRSSWPAGSSSRTARRRPRSGSTTCTTSDKVPLPPDFAPTPRAPRGSRRHRSSSATSTCSSGGRRRPSRPAR